MLATTNIAMNSASPAKAAVTGIIGHLMPMDKVEAGIRDAGQYLGDSLEHAHLFADAILTTDLKRKAGATASAEPNALLECCPYFLRTSFIPQHMSFAGAPPSQATPATSKWSSSTRVSVAACMCLSFFGSRLEPPANWKEI